MPAFAAIFTLDEARLLFVEYSTLLLVNWHFVTQF